MRFRFGQTVLGSLATLAVGLVPGCGENTSETVVLQPALSANALTANALTANALTANALTANALTANALTANALTANALTANSLRDPLARDLLKYVVSCALPAGTDVRVSVDGVTYVFPGEIGLAPEWGDAAGQCSGTCQRWVSACVLARVDYAGVKRFISVRGAHRALGISPREVAQYPIAEGAYYGNLFAEGQHRYLCPAPGQTSVERVCGPSMDNCPMQVMNACNEVCAMRGPASSFRSCETSASEGELPQIDEVVTVFLPKS